MRKRFITTYLIAFFAIHAVLVFSQEQRLSFHHLTTEEGLSQASNDYIYHDSKGFIWLSSLDGLNRFDGQSVKIYKSISGDSTSLLGNILTSNFYEDEQSNIWFTTYEGIHSYIRKKDHFHHFQITNKEGQTLQQDYHAFHLDNKKQLWVRVGIGQSGRLYLFDIQENNHRELCGIDGQHNHIILDEKGEAKQIVSYTFNDKPGIEILNMQPPFKIQSFFNKPLKNNAIPYIYHCLPESDSIWYLATDLGLILWNPQKNSSQVFSEYGGQALGNVFTTLNLNDTILWVASSEQSLLFFNKNSEKFIHQIPHEPQRKFGLQLNPINKLYKDRNENVWISSPTSGVNFANLKKRKFDTPTSFLGRSINAIYETQDKSIFCSDKEGAVVYFKNSTSAPQFVSIILPDNIPQNSIRYFFEDGEANLWAISGAALLKWNNAQVQFEYVQNLPNYFLSFHKNKEGHILLATYGGIYEWKKEQDKVSFAPFSVLNEHQSALATAIYEDQNGRLYLALDASQLLILELEGTKYKAIKQIEGIGYAKAFYEADQNLWVATSTGLIKINLENLKSHLLNEAEDGVPNESYYSILSDEFGSFWMSCNRGVIRYFPTEKKYRRYTLIDGLQGNEYNTNSFLKTSAGEIWLGGTQGLNRFLPAAIRDVSTVPEIQITQLQINDEAFETTPQIGELETLDLSYQNNTVSLNFVSLEYSDPSNNQLQYHLENHEEDWVLAEENGFARYSNLPPGNYVFKVRAANSDGLWNETPRSLKINIQTPWWRTWWFYLSCILIIGGIIYGILMYRLQQALKIERMRVRISSDLHDDVGSLLAGLTMQTELLEITATKSRQPKLKRISELSRSAMSRMRDTVWAIDARKDKLKNLLDRIREHASETLELKNIAFELTIKDLAFEKNVPTQIRQNLYLICKEAITNTAKHSTGNQLKIQFSKHQRKGILLTIHDNGEVKKSTHQSAGLGLSNMHLRAEQIKGKLEISVDDGFLIRLYLPS